MIAVTPASRATATSARARAAPASRQRRILRGLRRLLGVPDEQDDRWRGLTVCGARAEPKPENGGCRKNE